MPDDAIERARECVADAIRKADEEFGYSIRLTRLVDDEATYTLTFPGETPLEFASNDDANDHVRAERDKRRADAVLLAFASQQAPAAGPLPEKRGLEELALLYNHADDDSRQFTRWQMLAAINHGIRLSAMLDAAPSVTLGEVG